MTKFYRPNGQAYLGHQQQELADYKQKESGLKFLLDTIVGTLVIASIILMAITLLA